jgi:amidase
MNFNEYATHDAVGLAELVQSGQVSAEELFTVAQEAVSQVNPQLNAVAEIYETPSSLYQPNSEGRLYGVPFGIKDFGAAFAGQLQEANSGFLRGYRCEQETYLAQSYRNSGLLTVARTTIPEFGYNTCTDGGMCGVTHNPWDVTRNSGGSSGGSAALVAAGALPVAHANDGGGSIRIPAAYCGLVGLKPTRNRISVGPGLSEVLFGMGCEHVVCRSVRDSAVLLDISSGARTGDFAEIPPPNGSFLDAVSQQPKALKIGMIDHPWTHSWGLSDSMETALHRTAHQLEDLGHCVETTGIDVDKDEFDRAVATSWCSTVAATVLASAAKNGREPSPEMIDPAMFACYEYGLGLSAVDVLVMQGFFNQLCRQIGKLFEQYDVLLTPTTVDVAPRNGVLSSAQSGFNALSWTKHIFGPAPYTASINITGHPAISLPLQSDPSGMPLGMHFIGRFADEVTLFNLAGQLERAYPWIDRKPSVWVGNPFNN